jgi:hypothetical protein
MSYNAHKITSFSVRADVQLTRKEDLKEAPLQMAARQSLRIYTQGVGFCDAADKWSWEFRPFTPPCAEGASRKHPLTLQLSHPAVTTHVFPPLSVIALTLHLQEGLVLFRRLTEHATSDTKVNMDPQLCARFRFKSLRQYHIHSKLMNVSQNMQLDIHFVTWPSFPLLRLNDVNGDNEWIINNGMKLRTEDTRVYQKMCPDSYLTSMNWRRTYRMLGLHTEPHFIITHWLFRYVKSKVTGRYKNVDVTVGTAAQHLHLKWRHEPLGALHNPTVLHLLIYSSTLCFSKAFLILHPEFVFEDLF